MNPLDVAKEFLADNKQYSHMEDGHFVVSDHDTDVDSHAVNILDDVNHPDIKDNEYHVVTVSKDMPIEGAGNFTIPKIIKIQVSKTDNSIQSVLESK